MSFRHQKTAIQAVLSETDVLHEFAENVSTLNNLGPMVKESETKLGTFDSTYGKSYQITLYIGAKIEKKEVEHEQ